MNHDQLSFSNSGKGWGGGGVNPPCLGGDWKFYWEGTFLPSEGNLGMGDFDDSNLFQS